MTCKDIKIVAEGLGIVMRVVLRVFIAIAAII